MLAIVHFLLTLSLIQHINFEPHIILNLMVCIGFISLGDCPLNTSIGLPCDVNGKFLPQHTKPPPAAAPDTTEENPWHPFEDRLAFNWVHYHFIELQSSEQQINKGLDLWLAATLKAGNNTPLPWSSGKEMYATIDSIQEGDAPFKTIHFKYSGPIPPNPPHWMTEAYELCMQDS